MAILKGADQDIHFRAFPDVRLLSNALLHLVYVQHVDAHGNLGSALRGRYAGVLAVPVYRHNSSSHIGCPHLLASHDRILSDEKRRMEEVHKAVDEQARLAVHNL